MSLDQGGQIVKSQASEPDAFLSGLLELFQPTSGFRAGTDSVLLGASVAATSTHILDLGSGVGAASLCALARLPNARATLTEINADYVVLAQRNITHNDLAARADIVTLDITSPGKTRQSAGIKSDHYTSVIANPPFFETEQGTSSPNSGRAKARAMDAPQLDKWVRAAATAAAPGGEIIFIYRASGLTELLNSFSRFGSIMVLPIAARPDEAASRILVRGIKGSRAPLSLNPTLVTHAANGNDVTPQIDAILRHGTALHW